MKTSTQNPVIFYEPKDPHLDVRSDHRIVASTSTVMIWPDPLQLPLTCSSEAVAGRAEDSVHHTYDESTIESAWTSPHSQPIEMTPHPNVASIEVYALKLTITRSALRQLSRDVSKDPQALKRHCTPASLRIFARHPLLRYAVQFRQVDRLWNLYASILLRSIPQRRMRARSPDEKSRKHWLSACHVCGVIGTMVMGDVNLNLASVCDRTAYQSGAWNMHYYKYEYPRM